MTPMLGTWSSEKSSSSFRCGFGGSIKAQGALKDSIGDLYDHMRVLSYRGSYKGPLKGLNKWIYILRGSWDLVSRL